MKELILVRHAKSSWDDPITGDKERSLNERGFEDAAIMGDYIKSLSIIPDVIISSPALRAKTTAEIISEKINFPKLNIILHERLYQGNSSDVIDILSELDKSVNLIMLFGHNPYITTVSSYLTAKIFHDIPTTGMLDIVFPIDDWKDVGSTAGEIKFFQFPKNFKK